jgi:hypothetical protein
VTRQILQQTAHGFWNAQEAWEALPIDVRERRVAAPASLVLGFLAGIIQSADAIVGIFQHDLGKSIGPAVIAVLQFCVIYNLKRSVQHRAGE